MTRNQQKRASLIHRKNKIEGMMLPMHREIAYIDTQIELIEMQLQARFGSYMESIGETVKIITISLHGQKGSLKPDFYLEARNWVVEAKPSASREHIRLAIGQVLDYTNLLKMSGKLVKPAILLPMPPPQDLKDLLKELQIQLIVETELGEYTFA